MTEFFPSNQDEAHAYEKGHELAAFAVALLHVESARSIRDVVMDRLEHEATHDPLTGLLNRRGFSETFDEYAERYGGGQFGVVYIDLKDFKQINDTLGHETGDKLLVDFATKLQKTVRKENGGLGDRAARMDDEEGNSTAPADILRLGDEFIILVDLSHDRQKKSNGDPPDTNTEKTEKTPQERLNGATARIALEMTEMLRSNAKYNGVEVSIGSALWNKGQSSAELVESAETNMRDHKSTQRAENGSYR